jgi:hypothetical protein
MCGGGSDADETGGGDPDYVAWHCTEGDGHYQCHNSQRGDAIGQQAHSKCGYRVMLPLDPGMLPAKPV